MKKLTTTIPVNVLKSLLCFDIVKEKKSNIDTSVQFSYESKLKQYSLTGIAESKYIGSFIRTEADNPVTITSLDNPDETFNVDVKFLIPFEEIRKINLGKLWDKVILTVIIDDSARTKSYDVTFTYDGESIKFNTRYDATMFPMWKRHIPTENLVDYNKPLFHGTEMFYIKLMDTYYKRQISKDKYGILNLVVKENDSMNNLFLFSYGGKINKGFVGASYKSFNFPEMENVTEIISYFEPFE